MQASISVKVAGAAAVQLSRASSGSKRHQRRRTAGRTGRCAAAPPQARRLQHVLQAHAHGADEAFAGQRAVLGAERQRRIVTKATAASTALSTNTAPLPTLARIAPAITGPTMRDTFIAMPLSASAARQLLARHQLGHDGGEHRPAHRQPDAVGEGQHQQQRRRQRTGQRQRGQQQRDQRPPTAAWRRSSGAGRRCRPARRWAGRAGTPASVEAVCTSATITGLVVSVVISQAAATSFIHMRDVGRQPGQPQHAEHRRCAAARRSGLCVSALTAVGMRRSIARPRRTTAGSAGRGHGSAQAAG